MKQVLVWLAAAWMGALGGMAQAGEKPVIVVELFTSQGCSSCPPADAFLHELAKRPDVVALSLHVDYWDYIGWKDVFASPEFTRRQHSYAHVGGRRSVYTPQMIIQGQEHVVGAHPKDVEALIRHYQAVPPEVRMQLERKGAVLVIRAEAARPAPMLVQLVRYSPHQEVKIRRGENAGHSYDYANVVRELKQLAKWDGRAPLRLEVPVPGPERAAVIIQKIVNKGFGPVEAVARAD